MFKKTIRIIKSAFGGAKNFEDAFESDELVSADIAKKTNNNSWRSKQTKLFIGLLVVLVMIVGGLINYVQEKVAVEKIVVASDELKVELADKALDPDTMWRNHHEEELKAKTDELNKRIVAAEKSVEETKERLITETQGQIEGLMEQLKAARFEMLEANQNLKDITNREQERINAEPGHVPSVLEAQGFDDDTEFDVPKSTADYVPEGTYFTGYLLGGIVVSTALGTPDDNVTPLTIQLKSRGNLAKENQVDISKCRITGSAYGDISSERAIIRLEKMICEEDGMYITSHIAGDVHGPDGFNGIKGVVVSTGSKHIKNAMLGGLISGLANNAKGQEGVNLTAGGIVSTKSLGFKDMAKNGLMSGTSNAGDKIADYYLRQAESMSPVLTISGGTRVNPHITKGFFIGEISTHRKIKANRLTNSEYSRSSKAEKKQVLKESIKENGSDDDWK